MTFAHRNRILGVLRTVLAGTATRGDVAAAIELLTSGEARATLTQHQARLLRLLRSGRVPLRKMRCASELQELGLLLPDGSLSPEGKTYPLT